MLIGIRGCQAQTAAGSERWLVGRAIRQYLAAGRRTAAVRANIRRSEASYRTTERLRGQRLRPRDDANEQCYSHKTTTQRGLHSSSPFFERSQECGPNSERALSAPNSTSPTVLRVLAGKPACMGEEAGEPPVIFTFALGSVKAKAAAGTASQRAWFPNRVRVRAPAGPTEQVRQMRSVPFFAIGKVKRTSG